MQKNQCILSANNDVPLETSGIKLEVEANKSMKCPISISSIRPLQKDGFPIEVPENGIDFYHGVCTAVIGSNGSGKTTILEALLRIRLDYDVSAKILGYDSRKFPVKQKRRLGISTQSHWFSDGVTIGDIVRMHSSAYGQEINQGLLDAFNLNRIMKQTYIKTSGGQKKRISLYLALAHSPELCILDEPDTGLDRQGIEALVKIIHERKQCNNTTVVVTHDSKLFGHSDNVVYMANGKIEFSGTKEFFFNHKLGESVMEIDQDTMSPNILNYALDLGATVCEDNAALQRFLLFGSQEKLDRIQLQFKDELQNNSINRKIRDGDVFIWMNAKETQTDAIF